MDIHEKIIEGTVEAIKNLYNTTISKELINTQATGSGFKGEVTIVTFPLTKFSKQSPEETGNVIGEYLKNHISKIVNYNTIKGFLNLEISDVYWIHKLNELANDSSFGMLRAKDEKVMVEYSSPNTNKPLHLGHIRNNLLGYSISNILKSAGYNVVKVNLINDRGIHICKSMLAWQKFGNGETPESSGMKGDHLVGKYYVEFDKVYKEQIQKLKAQGMSEEDAKKNAPIINEAQEMLVKWERKDEAVINLWKKMNEWVYAGFDTTYKALGVDFDKYYYESNTYLLGKDIIEEGLTKGVFFRKEDGSVWIDLSAEGLDQKLVLRADGTSVYITQDLGTAQMKYKDFGMERSIYVVGNEQEYHFKVLFLILKKLGKPWAKGLHHLSYGMVDLPSGKMKSREGTVVDADELINEMIESARVQSEQLGKLNDFSEEEKNVLFGQLGMGALKYFLLKVDPKKRLLFNPNESIDLNGNTGPFIQYSYARICSVLRKANKSIPSNVTIDSLNANEKECILLVIKFHKIIQEAAENYSPAVLANYLYDLAKTFNKFYHDEPILKLEDEQRTNFRLFLCEQTGKVIEKGMGMLGIEVPERM